MEEKMTITLLPARKKPGLAKSDEENPKLRVAAYCRVSTDSDEQETSYDAQISHYTSYINSHPDWELAGIYAEEEISEKRWQIRSLAALWGLVCPGFPP